MRSTSDSHGEKGTEVYRSLRVFETRCTGCMKCMRACPTHAIRIRDNHPVIIPDRCIDCGECVRACPEKAIRPKSHSFIDLARYDYLIAIPCSPLLVQFQHDVGPVDVAKALEMLGFDEVDTMDHACGIYMTALAELLLSGTGKRPFITTQCPVIVRLVRTIYPDLTENLVPLEPPRGLAARLARERAAKETGLPPEKIGIVYITPCPSKVIDIEAHQDTEDRHIDAAIPLSEVYHSILTAISQMRRKGELTGETKTSIAIGYSFLGGMSRNQRRVTTALDMHLTGHGQKGSDELDFLPVAQIGMVRHAFEAMEKGRLQNVDLLECMACPEGCVGGSLVVDNPYLTRSKAIKLLRKMPPPEDYFDLESALLQTGVVRLPHGKKHDPIPPTPLDTDFRQSLIKMQKKEELIQLLPGIDCGVCGAPTCKEFADDIVRDTADVRECIVLKAREQLDTD